MIKFASTLIADTETDALAEAGFDGIALTPEQTIGDQGQMTLATATWGLRLLERSAEDEVAAMSDHLDALKSAGVTTVPVFEASNSIHAAEDKPLSRRPELPASDMSTFATRLEQVALALEEKGFVLAYRHRVGTIVQTPDEIDRLMLETGEKVRLAFDTGHCYFGGGDPVQTLTRHMPRLAHAILSNIRVGPMAKVRMDDLSLPTAKARGVFCAPGNRDGSVDFKTVMNLLSASGYDGWIVVDGAESAQDASAALGTVKALAGKSGLEAA